VEVGRRERALAEPDEELRVGADGGRGVAQPLLEERVDAGPNRLVLDRRQHLQELADDAERLG
jgi:hypothetical protein